MFVSQTEADIRYMELVDLYIKTSDSGKMTEKDEAKFFNDMEEFGWYISVETKDKANDKINHWLRSKT